MGRLASRLWSLLRSSDGAWARVRLMFDGLYVVRGPMLVAMFGFLALSLPDQTIEIYRILALDADEPGGTWRIAIVVVTLAIASISLWYIGRRATLRRRRWAQHLDGTLAGSTLVWAPRLAGAALPAGVALGLYLGRERGLSELQLNELAELDSRLFIGMLISIALGLLLVVFTIYRHRLPWPRAALGPGTMAAPQDHLSGAPKRRRGLFSAKTDLVILMLALGCMAVNWLWPVTVPQYLGALPPFFLFLVLLVVVLSGLFVVDDLHRIPLTLLLIGAFVLFSWRDWGNHHALTTLPRKADLPRVDQAFLQWYAARVDREAYEGRGEPYPVFVVAAPGGGLYSAQFTATVLARLQDACPKFAHHTFAISGVSGGSLGAAVFSSLARRIPPDAVAADRCDLSPRGPQPRSFSPGAGATLEAAVSEFMARDFMAPVSTAALFLDAPQRLLPFPLLPFDRAGAQERAFALAWDDVAAPAERLVARGNVFNAPFLDHWDPKGSAPALMLNATEVSRGHRVVIAPFELGLGRSDTMLMRRLLSFHKLLGDIEPDLAPGDISLATAVGISARFPWLMPAAPLGPLRLVDGAVFENSGVDTAMDLIAELRRYDVDAAQSEAASRAQGQPRIRLTLIVVHNFDDYQPREGRTPSWFMAPIQALLSARAARASFAVSRADDALCADRGGSCITSDEPHRGRAFRPLQPIYLDHIESALTLGWHLSRDTRQRIADQASRPSACRMDASPPAPRGEQSTRDSVPVHNGCSACFILSRLAPDPTAALARCGQEPSIAGRTDGLRGTNASGSDQ